MLPILKSFLCFSAIITSFAKDSDIYSHKFELLTLTDSAGAWNGYLLRNGYRFQHILFDKKPFRVPTSALSTYGSSTIK